MRRKGKYDKVTKQDVTRNGCEVLCNFVNESRNEFFGGMNLVLNCGVKCVAGRIKRWIMRLVVR